MYRLILLLVLLTGSGCTSGTGENLPCTATFTYTTDVYGETGLFLESTDSVMFVSFDELEDEYRDVEMCVVNNKTPGPNIRFQSFIHLGIGGGWGVYSPATQHVIINTDGLRNCHSDRQTSRHEFVHHILYMNGQDWSHTNNAFSRCNALGVKTCNGVPCASS